MKDNLKIIILFIATYTLFSCSVDLSKNVKNSLADQDLIGRVKCLTTKSYDGTAVLGEFRRKGISFKRIEFFNKDGNITKQKEYWSGEKLTSSNIYNYDSNGKLVGVNSYDSKDTLRSKFTRINDPKGNILEGWNYNSLQAVLGDKERSQEDYNKFVGKPERYVYKNDANGNKIEKRWYISDGSVQ